MGFGIWKELKRCIDNNTSIVVKARLELYKGLFTDCCSCVQIACPVCSMAQCEIRSD